MKLGWNSCAEAWAERNKFSNCSSQPKEDAKVIQVRGWQPHEFLTRITYCSVILCFSTGQVQLQPKPLVGVRGQNLIVVCSFSVGTVNIRLNLNGNNNIQNHQRYLGVTILNSTAVEYRFGPLEDLDNGSLFTCTNLEGSTDSATLDINSRSL